MRNAALAEVLLPIVLNFAAFDQQKAGPLATAFPNRRQPTARDRIADRSGWMPNASAASVTFMNGHSMRAS